MYRVLLGYKESTRGYARTKWNLRKAKSVTMEQLWTWVKVDGHKADGLVMNGEKRYTYFEK